MSRSERDQAGGHPIRHPSMLDCLCCPATTRRDAGGGRAERERAALLEQEAASPIEPPPEPDEDDPLAHVASLAHGWDGRSALAPTDEAIAGARAVVAELSPKQLGSAGIYPLEDGSLLIEWSAAGAEGEAFVKSIEVLRGGLYEVFALVRGQEACRTLDTASAAEAVQFADP